MILYLSVCMEGGREGSCAISDVPVCAAKGSQRGLWAAAGKAQLGVGGSTRTLLCAMSGEENVQRKMSARYFYCMVRGMV